MFFFSKQNKPNVDSRIDPSDNNIGNTPSGYFGVQSSSFSSSSDINGIKKHKESATTTINDNGKVSSYTVENWCFDKKQKDDTRASIRSKYFFFKFQFIARQIFH